MLLREMTSSAFAHSFKRFAQLAVAGLALAGLAACGGGGSSTPAATAPTTPTTPTPTPDIPITPAPATDHPNTLAAAVVVAAGATVEGSIDPADDVDFFKLQLTDPGTVTFWTTGEADTAIGLLDGEGNDLSPTVSGGRVSKATSLDEVFARVSGQDGSTGPYALHNTLASAAEDRYPNTEEAAVVIAAGAAVEGFISPVNDVDVFKLPLTVPPGKVVTFWTTGELDPEIALFGWGEDEGDGSPDSANLHENLTFSKEGRRVSVATALDEVFVRVQKHGSTGPYTLHNTIADVQLVGCLTGSVDREDPFKTGTEYCYFQVPYPGGDDGCRITGLPAVSQCPTTAAAYEYVTSCYGSLAVSTVGHLLATYRYQRAQRDDDGTAYLQRQRELCTSGSGRRIFTIHQQREYTPSR